MFHQSQTTMTHIIKGVQTHTIIEGLYMVGPKDGIPTAYVSGLDNARLYAAAPDLLEALEICEITLKAFLPNAWATLQVAQTAIKKAKGL